MRTIINYIRSCFCKHEWESLPMVSKTEPGAKMPWCYIQRWRCKKCGYIMKSKT